MIAYSYYHLKAKFVVQSTTCKILATLILYLCLTHFRVRRSLQGVNELGLIISSLLDLWDAETLAGS